MPMKRALMVGLVAGLVLGSAIVTEAAVFRNGRISFTRWDYGTSRVGSYSVRPDGSDARPILADGKGTTGAAYSPNGRRIAVQVRSGGEFLLQIIDLHGNVLRTVGTFDDDLSSVSWSPRGSKLALCGYLDSPNRSSVWTIRRDGTGLRKVADKACTPTWSPNGRWIMVEQQGRCDDFPCPSNIALVRPSGEDRHVVIRDGFIPDWSPAGRRIVFYRFIGPKHDMQGDLFIANADGTNERQITHSGGWSEGAPAWSPNGEWIAYSRWDPADPFVGELFKVRIDTLERVRLSHTNTKDEWIPIDWQRRPV